MEFLTEYAGAFILGLIVFLLIAYTIRGQFKSKSSCGCGSGSCAKSTCACAQTTPSNDTIDKNSKN